MTRRRNGLRVLVATDGRSAPLVALARARALAGRAGEVVLEVVATVPRARATTSPAPGVLDRGCRAIEDAERRSDDGQIDDTRLVRARDLTGGVLATLSQEPFDMVIIECPADESRGAATGLERLVAAARVPVLMVRPRRDAADTHPAGPPQTSGRLGY